jgi:hypothetical protein
MAECVVVLMDLVCKALMLGVLEEELPCVYLETKLKLMMEIFFDLVVVVTHKLKKRQEDFRPFLAAVKA